MEITTLTDKQQAAIIARTPEGVTPQAYLDSHTLALIDGWAAADQDTYMRGLYERIKAAPADVQSSIITAAKEALA